MNFKKILLVTILMFFAFSCQVFAEDKELASDGTVYLGLNIGGEFFTGVEDSVATKAEGFLLGGSFKYFPGTLGLGLSYLHGSHAYKDGWTGTITFDTQTLDFMVNLNKNSTLLPYAFLSAGLIYTDGYYSSTTEGSFVYGGGIGAFTLPSSDSSGFSVGGEIKYLVFNQDWWRSDGLLLGSVSLGYVF